MAAESLAAILLAGGLSRRMGEVNKLHLPVNGVPLLRLSVEILLCAGIDEIVVVLGHERERSESLLSDLPVRTVFNANYAAGQMSSVHCGLAAVTGSHHGVFVALGDQPSLQVHHFKLLGDAFTQRNRGDVVVPFFKGQRGNPIVISETCCQSILTAKPKFGCRRFIENNPALVLRVDMPDDAVLTDLDTPADYQSFQTKRPDHGKNIHRLPG